MKEYKVFEVDEDIIDITIQSFPEEASLLQVKPPKNSGIRETKEFLENGVFDKRTDNGDNVSPVCGLEFFYQGESFNTYFYVPNTKMEQKYRRQINSYFEGAGIDAKGDQYVRNTETNEFEKNEITKFIPTEKGEYITGARFFLKDHFFRPVRSNKGVRTFDSDPYKPIFNEIDSRDGTKAVLQILYKPAKKDWTHTNITNVSEHAEKLRESNKTEERLGGLISKEKELPNKIKKTSRFIEEQEEERAYHVNVRLIIISDEKENLKSRAREIDSIIESTFKEKNGQTFDPRGVENIEEMKNLLTDVVKRKEYTMNQLNGIKGFIKEILYNLPITGKYVKDIYKNRMIMTSPELAGIAHIPNSNKIKEDQVNWASSQIGGSLPSAAQSFKPLNEKEKEVKDKVMQGELELNSK